MLKKIVCIIISVILLLSICGCQSKELYTGKNPGMTCANAVMGHGQFAFSNDFIYFYYANSIYEYDIQTEKTLTLNMEDTYPEIAFLSEDYIYYKNILALNELRCITKDGKAKHTLFEREGVFHYPFADGMNLYFLDGGLIRRDMTSGEETMLIASAVTYHIDDSSIYAVVIEDDEKWSLYRSDIENILFTKVELTFEPMAVYSTGSELYLAERCYTANAEGLFSCQIIRYSEGQETELPIYSTYYRILDNCVIYSDDNTYENSRFTVKSYDLETGEESVLCNDVFDFCILEERYICFRCQGKGGIWWDLLDWQTGETVRMHQLT